MSCFAMRAPTSSSSSRSASGRKSWRWWRMCAGLAAAAHSRLRRSVRVRWSAPGVGARRRAPPSVQGGWCGHNRSFAPVYVDELYSQQPKSLSVVHEEKEEEEPHQPSTSKLTRAAGGNKARVGAAATTGGNKARVGAAVAGVRSFLLSPSRGGGGVGMGEVDVRAELFIRKFREEMRLQRQRSAEEFQAMLARGL